MRLNDEDIDEYLSRELAYHLFWEYCLFQDRDFFTQRPFLKQVADAFQWVYDEYIQGRARSITVSLPPRAGKCLHPDSKIYTDIGWKHLKDIEIGDSVIAYKDGVAVIEKVIAKEASVKPQVRIKYMTGESVVVSPEHRLLTFDGYKAAGEITTSDFLIGYKLGVKTEAAERLLLKENYSLLEVYPHKIGYDFSKYQQRELRIGSENRKNISKRKFARLKEINPSISKYEMADFYYCQVKEVEHISEEIEMFDIQTSGDNNFVVNGIVSHNSYITSLFCAWWLGKLPELSVMRNSSTGSLYNKLSYDTRKIVRSERYMLVFPDVHLSADNQKVAGWNLHTSKQVGYFGAGVGGQIIGFGANLAIYDDLYRNLKEALSNERNDEVLSWKGADHNSRKELNCPEIGIGTRWRVNDVIGKEIERGNVDRVFKIPALQQTEQGEWVSFCEAVNRTSFYLKEKRDVDPIIFNAEYMQEPMEAEGLLFSIKTLNMYNPETVKPEELSEYRLGVIDPANQGGDDLSAPAGYLVENKIYIHDVVYNKQGTDVNEDALYLFIKKNSLNGVRFEGNSAWYLLAGNIRKKLEEGNSDTEMRIMHSSTNKHTRILAQAAFIRNHFVFRSDWEDIPEYRAFIKNLTSYMATGGAAHDDAPDSCAELAKYFREMLPELW